jgi:Fe-S cluster assembly scaffold protein SufB
VPRHLKHCKNNTECDALLINAHSRTDTYPAITVRGTGNAVQHEASVSQVSAEQIFYMQQRGLTEGQAMSLSVNGFVNDLVRQFPMEYSVELKRLIDLEMEGRHGRSGAREFDQRTLQIHQAPNTKSDLLYKNALLDQSRTIFSGLIIVDPDAQKTDAYQSNRNLMLSDDAESNSLPGPGDPGERRPLHPRGHELPDRPRAGVLPEVPRHPAEGGQRAPDLRLLRGGPEPARERGAPRGAQRAHPDALPP